MKFKDIYLDDLKVEALKSFQYQLADDQKANGIFEKEAYLEKFQVEIICWKGPFEKDKMIEYAKLATDEQLVAFI